MKAKFGFDTETLTALGQASGGSRVLVSPALKSKAHTNLRCPGAGVSKLWHGHPEHLLYLDPSYSAVALPPQSLGPWVVEDPVHRGLWGSPSLTSAPLLSRIMKMMKVSNQLCSTMR